MKSLYVCLKAEAESLAGNPSWAVISVHDPSTAPARLQPGWGAVLRLEFHDKEDVFLAQATGLWKVFTKEHGLRVLSFVEKHRDMAGLLVHCYAGASRSPAIARSICRFLGLRPDGDWPSGNQLVLDAMAEAKAEFERRNLLV